MPTIESEVDRYLSLVLRKAGSWIQIRPHPDIYSNWDGNEVYRRLYDMLTIMGIEFDFLTYNAIRVRKLD